MEKALGAFARQQISGKAGKRITLKKNGWHMGGQMQSTVHHILHKYKYKWPITPWLQGCSPFKIPGSCARPERS